MDYGQQTRASKKGEDKSPRLDIFIHDKQSVAACLLPALFSFLVFGGFLA